MNRSDIPLCVDLDGSLLRTDTLYESLLSFIKQSPLRLWRLPLWLASGRARLKRELAAHALPAAETLPLNGAVHDWLRDQQAQGRRLVLATGADRLVADAIAARLGCFDEVIASSEGVNRVGERKRESLVQRFGEKGFDYAGDSRSDLAVWRSARRGIVVGNEGLRSAAARVTAIERHFAQPPRWQDWPRALRLHQWAKNLLLFVPLLLARDVSGHAQVALAFFAFGLCASSVYVLNDLFDLAADRSHPRKRLRPFASGQLPLRAGLAMVPLLLTGAFATAAQLPAAFAALLGAYFLLTLAYSLRLKRIPMLDVLVLAALYTARVIAGGLATGIELSFWLLAFSAFLFLSLAIVKRCAELSPLTAGTIAGRGYQAGDLPLLQALGIAAGFSSVLVLALYINSPQSQALYAHARTLWALCPLLLLWLSRVWLLSHRGQMHDDPMVFALRDRASLAIGALFIAAILLAG